MNYLNRVFAWVTTTLVGGLLSLNAHAVPLLYNCKLVDYLASGPEVTEFQYWQVGEAKSFSSARSEVRIYLDHDHRIAITLSPTLSPFVAAPSYASTVGYDLPKRISVTLSAPEQDGYASRLDCRI